MLVEERKKEKREEEDDKNGNVHTDFDPILLRVIEDRRGDLTLLFTLDMVTSPAAPGPAPGSPTKPAVPVAHSMSELCENNEELSLVLLPFPACCRCFFYWSRWLQTAARRRRKTVLARVYATVVEMPFEIQLGGCEDAIS